MMQSRYSEAQDKGLSIEDAQIELLEEPEPETIGKAPESAFSQVMSGEVPKAEEDFIQDPAESADAVSETVAQEDTELLLDDGSTDLPSKTDDGKPLERIVLSAERNGAQMKTTGKNKKNLFYGNKRLKWNFQKSLK